jgi:hypothetical protein
MMRARKVALSGTSNTVERDVIENGRWADQSLDVAGRTRQV